MSLRTSVEQPLSIRATLWLAVSLAVASSVLGTIGWEGYRLHRGARISECLRTQALAEAYATQLAGRLEAGRRTELTLQIRELAWHPDSRLLAVVSPSGELLSARGLVQIFDRYKEASGANPGTTWHLEEHPGGLSPECTVAAIPIHSLTSPRALGTLVYAMVTPQADTSPGSNSWMHFVYILLIGATGVVLGVFWLQRRVLEPLALLSSVEDTGLTSSGTPLPVDRDDEIGTLARALAKMHLNIEQWRSRATRLERTLDDRVAHATERITRELKNTQKKVWTDALTQLGNRRLLEDKLEEIFQAQLQARQELSIIMIDIDNFKPLNDSLGHLAGDQVLEFTGELLKQCLREQDIAVRYGGDEFILILPSVTPEQAQSIAERSIAMFAQQSSLLPVRSKPGMSAGIASLQQHRATSASALLKMADAALYRAKKSGKARVCVYSPSMQAVPASS